MSDLKNLNLNLQKNLHRQQNKETQQTEQRAISKEPTDRTDQVRERNMSQTVMKSKTVTQGRIFLLLTEQADKLIKKSLKYRLEEYGKIKMCKD